ncbi:hypothetical protein Y032_0082g1520 [Ancylostoma ceylanicum]|uniref:Uncharacterized protein n=1 Tax=Ancylostoma ceylanicum TaxID=53326 RepID=A0A016TRC5_9BILA|nr:hypothetical protein Y032_0082g1520 [Ancylostoma ceylanicum]
MLGYGSADGLWVCVGQVTAKSRGRGSDGGGCVSRGPVVRKTQRHGSADGSWVRIGPVERRTPGCGSTGGGWILVSPAVLETRPMFRHGPVVRKMPDTGPLMEVGSHVTTALTKTGGNYIALESNFPFRR